MDPSRCYKSFSMIQTVAKWAGVLGAIQSVSWIILSIISILLYLCIFDLGNFVSYGTITKFVLYEMYFRGNCELDPSPDIQFEQLYSVETVLNSTQILIWACVYLGVSIVWLIGSCLLLTRVNKDNMSVSIAVLYNWAIITLITCCMDLSLGIIFGIDFSRYHWQGNQYSLSSSQIGPVNPDINLVQLLAAEFSAIFMMLISLKGFVLWLINFGFMIYVFIGAYVARDTVNDFINHTFNNTHSTPIHAFEPKEETGFDNTAFIVEQRQHTPVELNEESIKRAARMSTDNLQERRFRNIDSFEQYPPAKPPQLPLQQPQQQGQGNSFEPALPAPDYTPPMPRSNQNGHIRNSRYQ